MTVTVNVIAGMALGAMAAAGVAYVLWPEKRAPYYEEWWSAPEMWVALAYEENGKPAYADRYYPSRDACLKQAQALLPYFPEIHCIDPKHGRGLADPSLTLSRTTAP